MPDRWWREFLFKRLHDDPAFAEEYLNAAKASGDPEIYESARRDVEQARKGALPRKVGN